MYIETVQNNGNIYLRLVQSARVKNKAGLLVSSKKVLLNIGPLSRFDDGQPDYLERLRKSFRAGNPLIPSLLPYCDGKNIKETYRFSIPEGSKDCYGHPKLFCHVLLERILEELGINTFFSSYKGFSKMEYDVYGFAKLILFGRLLNPASKCATVRQNQDYSEPILKDFNPDNVYDTLSFIAANREKIIRRINTNLVKKAGRSPDVIYYDVTNFFFETEEPDDDILDDDGNVLAKGLRQMGVCKEERHQPIVQMGLFMDDDGIPIAVESFPGNTLDQLTLRPAMKKTIDQLEFSRFILIADRGVCNYANIMHLLDAGNGYIVSKSLLKSSQKEREWAYDDDGYTVVSPNFKYKSRIVKKTVQDEKGNNRHIEEKVVVYWDRKFEERSIRENRDFLEFLKKLEESPNSFRITATQNKSLKKFMKKDYVNTKTGEVIDSSSIKGFIDFDKVVNYRKSLGYYQIVTSELTMDPRTVIDKYHGLTQIENQFRMMKGPLETRPIYVRTREHIDAHLLLCMIALVMLTFVTRIQDVLL